MSDSRLLKVLNRRRADLAPDVSAELISEIAAIEERNQYDDERRKVLKELRDLFDDATDKIVGGK
jgi:hypothetical protein